MPHTPSDHYLQQSKRSQGDDQQQINDLITKHIKNHQNFVRDLMHIMRPFHSKEADIDHLKPKVRESLKMNEALIGKLRKANTKSDFE